LYLSKIFDWFRADFETEAASVQAYVAQYMDNPRVTEPDVNVKYLDYDWSLNDQTAP
jgi:hypothetical protein